MTIKTSNAVDASMWQESKRRRWLKEDFDFEVAKSRKLCCGSVLNDQVRALFFPHPRTDLSGRIQST